MRKECQGCRWVRLCAGPEERCGFDAFGAWLFALILLVIFTVGMLI